MKASQLNSSSSCGASPAWQVRVRTGVPLRLVLVAWAASLLPQAGIAASDATAAKPPLMDPTKPAFPGILTSPDPTKPPPFVELPHDPVPPSTAVDAATVAIGPALRAKIKAAEAVWRNADGGAEFSPGLTYQRGNPVVMLVTSRGRVRGQCLTFAIRRRWFVPLPEGQSIAYRRN